MYSIWQYTTSLHLPMVCKEVAYKRTDIGTQDLQFNAGSEQQVRELLQCRFPLAGLPYDGNNWIKTREPVVGIDPCCQHTPTQKMLSTKIWWSCCRTNMLTTYTAAALVISTLLTVGIICTPRDNREYLRIIYSNYVVIFN